MLVSWYFEPSQPQRWLKQTSICHLYLLFTQVIRPQIQQQQQQKPTKSVLHKFTYNKIYANVKHKIFEQIVLSVLSLLKKHIRLGHADIVDHSVDLSIPDFKKERKKEWTEAIIFLMLYKCITANTSAIWQYAAHTTDQLTFPSC